MIASSPLSADWITQLLTWCCQYSFLLIKFFQHTSNLVVGRVDKARDCQGSCIVAKLHLPVSNEHSSTNRLVYTTANFIDSIIIVAGLSLRRLFSRNVQRDSPLHISWKPYHECTHLCLYPSFTQVRRHYNATVGYCNILYGHPIAHSTLGT